MFFFLPTGSTAETNRRPLVTIVIAALCVAVFGWTGFLSPPPEGERAYPEAMAYAREHPHLLEDDLEAFEDPELDEPQPERPSPEQIAADRKEFEALLARDLERTGGPERALSLVPSRGFAQIGWLTNLFVHFDLFHLLGNLLFLWLVGPLLEEAWGRRRFFVFYFAAGLFASLVQFLISRGEYASIGGASGAIAGCMGAFSLRFAATKIRFHYFIWFLRIIVGSVHVPAWLCGAFWFGRELLDLSQGGASGVATGAHVGGFVLGGAVALGMKALGTERELLTVAESEEVDSHRHGLFTDATAALAQGDAERARELASALQAEAPDYPGLAMLQAEADLRTQRGVARLEKVLRPMLTKADSELEHTVGRLWSAIDPAGFSSAFAWQLSERLRTPKAHVEPEIREALLKAVAAGSGALAIKARALLAPEPAVEARPAHAAPRVLAAKLLSVSRQGLQLDVEGAPRAIPFTALGAVVGGIVPAEGRRALLVDLVLNVGGQPTALRLHGADPAVPPLFPGKPVPDAWRAFIEATRRAANVQPGAAPWAEFATPEAMTNSWTPGAR